MGKLRRMIRILRDSPTPLFPPNSEMAELIRSFDWSSTPIGPMESWSPALRTMVSILLANRFPILLWWGPEYIQLYNDAYRPIPGTKHPDRALGRPARECWSEIWHILQPLVDTPFHGGPATWMDDISLEINRHGYLEETHFTIAYSPVPDETVASGIGGVVATVNEITGKVLSERRVLTLRDLAARSSDAKTAEDACATAAQTLAKHDKDIPFALFYLIDSDRKKARLVGATGVEVGGALSPFAVPLDDVNGGDVTWPLAHVVREESVQIVGDLYTRAASVPQGPWTDPPTQAAIVPVPSIVAHRLAAVLVMGISSRLRFDELYRDFFELVAGQVATAIANARAYEAERQRVAALAELDRAKTAFFSNVSHEFRTPLTLMLGPLEDALGSEVLPESEKERLATVHRNGLRLLKLVNTLLDFSRIEAGRIQAVYEPTDLAQCTTDLAGVFRSAVERAGLKLVVECPPLPEPVYVDREMWEKVVLNLLSNAFKFTFDGGITVSLSAKGSEARIQVRDTGIGIAPEELPRMFERFHRIRGAKARTHEGTGIGLALVQELVKLHGGSVQVRSELNRGTTFTITIPFGSAHLPQDRIQAPRTIASTSLGAAPYLEEALQWLPVEERDIPVAPSSEALVRPRILLADDNLEMRQYVGRLLGRQFEVEAVPDGAVALAAARRRLPDLVLTDVMMPNLDGFGLLRELRADEHTRHIPVILLSARAGEESRVEGLEHGADDYLIKPFSARELLARVQAHVNLAHNRQQAAEAVHQSAAQFEAVLNQAPLGVFVVDVHLRIRLVNPIALPAFGDMPDLIGRDFDEVLHIVWPKDRAEEILRIFRHTLATGEPYAVEEWAEQRLDRGVVEHYEWRIDRIRLADQRDGVVCYFRDISGHIAAREALRQSEQRLKQSQTSLQEQVIDLETFHDIAVSRELKMMELEKEVERLRTQLAETQSAPHPRG